jgi:hypothetical protein
MSWHDLAKAVLDFNMVSLPRYAAGIGECAPWCDLTGGTCAVYCNFPCLTVILQDCFALALFLPTP